MPPIPPEPTLHPSASCRSWLRWLPCFVLVCTGGLLGLLWPRLPPRWAIHWGLNGQPDGWTTKTFLGVLFPVGFGMFICSLLEGISLLILACAQRGKDQRLTPEAARTMAALTADCTRMIALGLALVCALLAVVLPLWQPARVGLLVLGVLLIVGGSIVWGVWWMWQGVRALQARDTSAQIEGWNGLFYCNPRDPRVWLPKLAGLGYTLNFAHRQAWWWLAVLLVLPLLGVLLVIVQALR